MPYFGNQIHTSGSPGYLSATDLFGHLDNTFMVSWGMPIPDCIVKKIQVYGPGPPPIEPFAIGQFGIYDASSGIPSFYTLVATSPTWSWITGTPDRWWFVYCSIPLAAGTYCLAILSNTAGAMGGGVHFDTKVSGPSVKTFITPGVFPSPIGPGVQSTINNWTMYADYVPAGAYAPTAAHGCQPKCGGA